MMSNGNEALADFIRATIQERGPVTFRWFMEQALYHPTHGYYSSGRCTIGRGGDYFTNVSVGSLFGRLMAKQFCEVWEQFDRPQRFTIVEQGAHDGCFARDVLEAAHAEMSDFFSTICYRIVEAIPSLRDQQGATLEPFRQKVEWRTSLDELEPFSGVHFSNELLDAMPVHVVSASRNRWREKYVAAEGEEFEFVNGPVSSERLNEHLKKPAPPSSNYLMEINLAALDWIEELSAKLQRGFVLMVDYGYPRDEFYSPERSTGTLRAVAQHRVVPSPLQDVGETDITAHVDWTSLSEHAEKCGLRVAGFTDQHHFITALAATFLPNELPKQDRTALQTLLHPGLLGRTFQFLALEKNSPPAPQLTGFKFARDPRTALGLSPR